MAEIQTLQSRCSSLEIASARLTHEVATLGETTRALSSRVNDLTTDQARLAAQLQQASELQRVGQIGYD